MKYALILLAVLFAAPAGAECPQDATAFCVLYKKKVQNIWANACILQDAPDVTVLYQGLCTNVPNAQ